MRGDFNFQSGLLDVPTLRDEYRLSPNQKPEHAIPDLERPAVPYDG